MSQEATTLTARQGANIRLLKDRLMSWFMGFGGISVIIAIVLIFFYLLYVVYPMFIPADMDKTSSYAIPAPDTGNTLHLALEEQNELGARFTDQGAVTFFNIKNGQTLKTEQLVDRKRKVTSFAHARLARGYIAFGLDNGEVIVARHKYRLVYGEKQRTIVPEVVFPLGQDPILLDEDTQGKLQQLALRLGDERATIAAATDNNTIVINRLVFDEEPDEEPVEFEKNSLSLPNIQNVAQLLINTDQRLLYIVH
ncbi:MAG: phosphate ABC transporter permease, partial [Thioalkalispiraceae bacterium]